MNDLLTNRDIAIIGWTAVFLIFVLRKSDVRKSVHDLLAEFFKPKLIIPFVLSLVPTALIVLFFNLYDQWSGVMTKTAIIWLLGAGIISFVNTGEHKDGKALLFKTIKNALRFTIVLEFLVNFYVFPLYVELFFVPVISLVVMVSAYADAMIERDEKMRPVKKFLDWLLVVIGLNLIAYALNRFFNDPSAILTLENAAELLLPAILAFAYVPSIYLLAVYSGYELLFLRLDNAGAKERKKAKLLCFRRAMLSLKKIELLKQYVIQELYVKDTDNILKSIRDFK